MCSLLAVLLCNFGDVGAAVEFTLRYKELVTQLRHIKKNLYSNCIILHVASTYLEKLHADTGKHEIQQHGDQDDVADGFDGHKHTLDHMLSMKSHSE